MFVTVFVAVLVIVTVAVLAVFVIVTVAVLAVIVLVLAAAVLFSAHFNSVLNAVADFLDFGDQIFAVVLKAELFRGEVEADVRVALGLSNFLLNF